MLLAYNTEHWESSSFQIIGSYDKIGWLDIGSYYKMLENYFERYAEKLKQNRSRKGKESQKEL